MRARVIARRHERREPGREDEDPLDPMDYGYLKLDSTEDDDYDEDDQVAQNKLLILVAKGVKTVTYAAYCLREKGVSMPRLCYRRAILQSDGEPFHSGTARC